MGMKWGWRRETARDDLSTNATATGIMGRKKLGWERSAEKHVSN
jgi:hypothetical protein